MYALLSELGPWECCGEPDRHHPAFLGPDPGGVLPLDQAPKPSQILPLQEQVSLVPDQPHIPCPGVFSLQSLLVCPPPMYFESHRDSCQTPTVLHYRVANPIRPLDNMSSYAPGKCLSHLLPFTKHQP